MPLNVVKVKSGVAITRPMSADELLAGWLAGGPAGAGAPWSDMARQGKSTREGVQAVLFDLDGVLVDTAEFHFQAWLRLAEELGVRFNRKRNDGFRGVGRMECLDKLLAEHGPSFAQAEKELLAERKNQYYLEQVRKLTPGDLAAGARALAMRLRAADGGSGGGVRMGLVSASRNARLVLGLLGITDWFEGIVDGSTHVRGKPAPDGFLRAAEELRVLPERCVVIEDAEAGIRAGHAAGMCCVGVGAAAYGADVVVGGIGAVTLEMIEQVWGVWSGRGLGKEAEVRAGRRGMRVG